MTESYQPKVSRYLPVRIPGVSLEVAFYLAMLYSFTSEIFGIEVPLLAGVLILGLAGICILQLRSSAITVYAPIGLLIACVISFIVVQVVAHDLSILDGDIRPFIIWILQLIIVHSLCLRRGFYLRYPLVLFFLTVATLPFLAFNPGEVERAHVDRDLGVQGGLSGGGLAEWCGFFAVYFAILGLQAKRSTHRIGAWLLMVGSLFIVGLAVGRSVLFGSAIAITVGFRGILRRGFAPVLLVIILIGVTYESGLFDQVIANYSERGMEETGREILWPAAIERIFSSPLVTLFGVGESKIYMDVLSARKANPPHNAFLHFALSSGVVPFAFFLAFWIQAAWRSVHAKGQDGDSFRIPFLLFTFVTAMFGDWGYMSAWALLTLSVAAGSVVFYGKQRLLVLRVGNKIRFGLFPGHKSPEKGTAVQSQS